MTLKVGGVREVSLFSSLDMSGVTPPLTVEDRKTSVRMIFTESGGHRTTVFVSRPITDTEYNMVIKILESGGSNKT